MAVVSFENYVPPARFDAISWTDAQIEEAATEDGAFAVIDTVAISVDVDPADPQPRDFTTTLGTGSELWYRVVFLDGASNTSEPTLPVQNIVTVAMVDADPYATALELFRILKIRTPTADQTTAADRVLATAAGEINSEIGRVNSDLTGWETDLAAQVNLDRAADLWRHTESIPGITGLLGDEGGVVMPGRYSWERYAQRLAPLKASWGLA